jgi:hypothetical protein
MQTSRVARAWHAATLTFVGVVATANVIHIAGKLTPPPTVEAPDVRLDYVTRCERRFAAFRQNARIRGLSGTIGYVENWHDGESSSHEIEADYFIAQFALLPLILDHNLGGHEWALANFRTSTPPDLPVGWRIVENFGQGVLLLGRSAP